MVLRFISSRALLELKICDIRGSANAVSGPPCQWRVGGETVLRRVGALGMANENDQ